jgi:cell wall-associated NlpC family hydrolase
LAQTPGTVMVTRQSISTIGSKLKKGTRVVAGVALSGGLAATFAFPAYATEIPQEGYQPANIQQLTVTNADSALTVELPQATTSQEIADEQRKQQAAATAETARVSQEKTAAQAATNRQIADVPVGAGAAGLVAAARAQIGQNQDCTALVERALRAIGYNVGDLGPMQFAAYGTPVAASAVQYGDIMMRGGHVGIYTGDGVNHRAVHGGFGGNQTVETTLDANPAAYILIVRVA